MTRSYKQINTSDLKQLVKLSLKEHEKFFKRNPEYTPFYKNALLAIVLGQGAAFHYKYCNYGIKDFDIYLFYKRNPKKSMRVRRAKKIKSNLEKFGNPNIDFIKKTIKTKYLKEGYDIKEILINLFNESKAPYIKYLTIYAKKNKNRNSNVIIGLYPKSIFSKCLWHGEVKEIR